jgi:vacuolar protein sorting-associated protein 13A/C
MYGGSGESGQPTQIHSNVLNLFLQSVGVVLSDIQDVIFKLGYFERNFKFYNQSQLTGEIGRHYAQQAIKQMYVLVLGLDVLGNPFGLVRGLAEGIEDLFYEPYQGAIQGPEEFAEGLALGVRSLFGHAVGGAAGAVSRITGALGKGIATLTMDDEYQKKRREAMAKKPTDFKEGLARGGKGLVMGVVDGVTGIVRKPMEGAKQEGVEGFFKGMGKGLVGVFTRPASGVVDFASTSFEGIRRATDMSEEVHRLRPPRFLHKDGILRPYIHREAEGNDIIKDIEKGKFAETDSYLAHCMLTKDLKNVLLVTDKRLILASKGEIFGHWDCDWQYTWGELREPPSLTSKGIQVLLKEKQKKTFFSHGSVGKLVPIEDKKTAEWMLGKMKEAMARVS